MWKGIFLVLLVAGSAHAQGRLDLEYERGDLISKEGGNKTVWSVKGHPDLVLLLQEPGRPKNLIEEEGKLLDELDAKGVPSAKFVAWGTYGKRPAAIQKRYEVSNKDQKFNDYDVRLGLLNENTVQDAEKIKAALKAHPEIDFLDFQVLIGKDGHVVVNDPFPKHLAPPPPVEPVEDDGQFGPEVEPDPQEELDLLIHFSRNAIEHRDLLERMRAMPGADDPALKGFFEHRYVGLPGLPEFDEKPVREGLLKYLEMGPTTDAALKVAKAVRDGTIVLKHKWTYLSEVVENELRITPADHFVAMASKLIFEGTKKLETALSGLEAEVKAEAERLAFLAAKKAPDRVNTDEVHKRATELRGDPEKLVTFVAAKNRATEPTAAEKTHLVDLSRTILGRPSRTSGVSGILGERIRSAADPAKDVEER
ncbi:MAG TPA: hypothetical protein VFF73_05890 [Planctomycetota bacterium]|nr:hypothetical protein [Planctomycetota bacterium]